MNLKDTGFMNDVVVKNRGYVEPKVSEMCLKPFFIASLCGGMGSGKTHQAVRIMKQLINEGVLIPENIYILTTTYDNNIGLFDNIGGIPEENIFHDISQAGEVIKTIEDRAQYEKKIWKSLRKRFTKDEYMKIYKTIRELVKYSPDDLGFDMDRITPHISLNQNNKEPIFYDMVPHYLLFIDDCFNTPIFSDSKKNPVKNFVIRHRHHNCSIILANQSFVGGTNKQLRKNIRLIYTSEWIRHF